MHRGSSYRSGIDASKPRPLGRVGLRSHVARLSLAVVGMLAPLSLGCTSTPSARGALRVAPPAALTATGQASAAEAHAAEARAGEVGEDPQLAAAFARLAAARAERGAGPASAALAARPNSAAAEWPPAAGGQPTAGGGTEVGRVPASEVLPGSQPARIPVWPAMR